MKKVAALAMAVVLVAGLAGIASARGRWGGMGSGPGSCWENRDWDGDERSLSRRGGGRGPGPEFCPDCPNSEGAGRFGSAPESAEDAAGIVAGYIERTGNPNLKVGKVLEAGRDFEVDIVTKDGSLANKVYVEKRTGRMIPAYR